MRAIGGLEICWGWLFLLNEAWTGICGLFAEIASRTRQVPGHQEESSSQEGGGDGDPHYPQFATAVD